VGFVESQLFEKPAELDYDDDNDYEYEFDDMAIQDYEVVTSETNIYY